MASIVKASGLGLALCLAGFLSAPASSEPAAWDQAKVTSLAQQLQTASSAFQATVLREPAAGPRLQQNSRTLGEQSKMLAMHLAKGDGKDKTKGFYRGLKEVADDTVELQSEAPFGETIASSWEKVADLMRQLGAYY